MAASDISLPWFAGKKVTVMGLGLHGGGLGSAVWLMRHGARVTVTDLKDSKALAPSVASLKKAHAEAVKKAKQGQRIFAPKLALGRHDDGDFSAADMVIKNPGVPRGNRFIGLAEAASVPIETDMSIFFRLCPFPVIGITGTRGKTTTATLAADILRARDPRTVLAGNIRVSVLSVLDSLLKIASKKGAAPPPVVLELSSWQLEGIEPLRMSPHIGLVTNLFEDHLNRYDGMEDYARAKATAVAFQKEGDIAILNADNQWTKRMSGIDPRTGKKPQGTVRWFSMKPSTSDGAFCRGGRLYVREGGKETALCARADIRVPGDHHVRNILAAAAVARAAGVPVSAIKKAVRAFRGVPYRQEEVARIGGVVWINDTTATSPDGAMVAMDAFAGAKAGGLVIIAGGTDKNLEFADWAKKASRAAKALVLLPGTATDKMLASLAAAKSKAPTVAAASMAEAVRLAAAAAAKGDAVLLSPGCASFGLFQHEFDRGDQFNAEVKKLAKKKKK